jgi:hypothetical protein
VKRAALSALLVLAACTGKAEGPLKGVLVVFSEGTEQGIDDFVDGLQLRVETITSEAVFDFSFVALDRFEGTLRNRRTILLVVDSPEEFPVRLDPGSDGIYRGRDVWAEGQYVFGAVPGSVDPADLSSALEQAYDDHMWNYVYGSFVSTQMSNPERIDSLAALGFTVDVPKSYFLESWRPGDGFVQYQRQPSDECLLMFSIRWAPGVSSPDAEDAILRREAMARRFFYDAGADSVDRSAVTAEPVAIRGAQGYRLTGVWRNPEHLNAGAFTSLVLDCGGTGYILDLEVYNPGREKEPYIREGWTIMDSFVPED